MLKRPAGNQPGEELARFSTRMIGTSSSFRHGPVPPSFIDYEFHFQFHSNVRHFSCLARALLSGRAQASFPSPRPDRADRRTTRNPLHESAHVAVDAP
jgi:hypothetical protein